MGRYEKKTNRSLAMSSTLDSNKWKLFSILTFVSRIFDSIISWVGCRWRILSFLLRSRDVLGKIARVLERATVTHVSSSAAESATAQTVSDTSFTDCSIFFSRLSWRHSTRYRFKQFDTVQSTSISVQASHFCCRSNRYRRRSPSRRPNYVKIPPQLALKVTPTSQLR